MRVVGLIVITGILITMGVMLWMLLKEPPAEEEE